MLTIWKTVSAKPICASEKPRDARIATQAPESEICPKTADEYNLFICFFMLNIIRRPLTAKKNVAHAPRRKGLLGWTVFGFFKKDFWKPQFF